MKAALHERLRKETVSIDAEFIGDEEIDPTVCCVAVVAGDREEVVWWDDGRRGGRLQELIQNTGAKILLSYYVPAEARALFLSAPVEALKWIDVYAEWRLLNNLNRDTPGPGCLSLEDAREALLGIGASPAAKAQGRRLVMDVKDPEDPWPDWGRRRKAIGQYCAEDARHLRAMLAKIIEMRGVTTEEEFDEYLDQAVLRGSYQVALALAERRGIPVDVPAMMEAHFSRDRVLRAHQDRIVAAGGAGLFKPKLKRDADDPAAVLGVSLKAVDAAVARLAEGDPDWPRNEPTMATCETGGSLKRDSATLGRALAGKGGSPEDRALLGHYRDWQTVVEGLKFFHGRKGSETWLDRTGSDGRLRPRMGAFNSTTMRNYPKAKVFPPVNGEGIRRFMLVPKGEAAIQCDWARQEFAIAAELSGDPAMVHDYLTGDPYRALAERCGRWDGRPETRDTFKTVVLGLSFGAGSQKLREFVAGRLGRDVPLWEARQWRSMFWDSYAVYRRWREAVARLYGPLSPLVLPDGTALWGADANPLSVQNFPVQATGGSLLRSAVVHLLDWGPQGPRLAWTLHDAIYAWSDDKWGAVSHNVGVMRACMDAAWADVAGEGRAIDKLGIDVTVYGKLPKAAAKRCEEKGWVLKESF